VGFAPSTTLEEGIARFVGWYRDYFQRGQHFLRIS
jgi:UDP-glucuronate 4-epimerase